MPTAHHRTRRMACTVELTVVAGTEADAGRAIDAAAARLDDLERRWSRFRADSEVSRCNAAAGTGPVAVAADTADLVATAVEVWLATGGVVDASVLPALERWGYDRSFDLLPPVAGPSPRPRPRPAAEHPAGQPPGRPAVPAPAAPGLGGVVVDRTAGTVELPAGVRLDLGGVGKGRMADEVAAAALAAGATGACIDLGGDVAVRGPAPDGGPWVVAVEDPFDPAATLTTVALADGAVATSGVLRRRWRSSAGEVHHLLDPRTGRPADAGVAAVTVVAADGLWAEVLAKAAVVLGLVEGVALLAASGASGLVVTDDGHAVRTAGFDRFEAPTTADPPTVPSTPRRGGGR